MGKVGEITKKISEATDGRVNMSGYLNGHYMVHDGTPQFTNSFLDKPLIQIREASLFTDILVTPDLMFSSELELSYDLSTTRNGNRPNRFEALFNYYYLEYDISSALDWDTDEYGSLSIRAGRILVPFLSYNENKPNFKQNLMTQPFTAWQLAPVNNVAASFDQFGWTDVGGTINWNRVMGEEGLLDVKFSIINGLSSNQRVLDNNGSQLITGPTVRPRDGLANAKSDWDDLEDGNDSLATVLKVSYTPFKWPVDVGVSWYNGKWDPDNDQNLSMWGVHFNYLEKDWTFKFEYVKADVEQTAGIDPFAGSGPASINTSSGDYNMFAWYVEGSFIPFRYGPDEIYYVRLIARWDEVDTNDKAVFTPFDRSRLTLGSEWEFLKNVRLRYEWQWNMIHNFENAPAQFRAAGGKENIYMHMISFIAFF